VTVGTFPVLSVVLPNYNHASVLPRALDALVAQDRPADEILIVDDGSTDGSCAAIADYAARHASIRLLANPRNLGIIPALQRGLDAARGSYVYFAASDDWVLPGFFSRALAMLETYPEAGFFCGNAILIDAETGRPAGYRPIARPLSRAGTVGPAETADLLGLIDNWIMTGSTVFRRDAIAAAGGLDTRLGTLADGMLARKVALTHGFCYAPVPAATWCVSSAGASRSTALNRSEDVLRTVPPIIAADPAFPAWYAELFKRRWRFATARLALERKPFDRPLLRVMGLRAAWLRRLLEGAWTVLPAPMARFVTLAVLWVALRPTSLIRVATSALAHRLGGHQNRK
jgi:hypothetical protein